MMADGRWPEVGKLYAEMNLDNAIRIVKVWRNPSRWFLKCIFFV